MPPVIPTLADKDVREGGAPGSFFHEESEGLTESGAHRYKTLFTNS